MKNKIKLATLALILSIGLEVAPVFAQETTLETETQYMPVKDGYVPNTTTEVIEEYTEDGYQVTEKTITSDCQVDLNAGALIDPNLYDHANNGFTYKVPHNQYAPYLALQHWAMISGDNVTGYVYRPLFTTKVGINDALLRITLPNKADEFNISNATNWAINRYLPATGDGNDFKPISYENIRYEGNDLLMDLIGVEANSALSFELTYKLLNPVPKVDFEPVNADVKITGTWDRDDLDNYDWEANGLVKPCQTCTIVEKEKIETTTEQTTETTIEEVTTDGTIENETTEFITEFSSEETSTLWLQNSESTTETSSNNKDNKLYQLPLTGESKTPIIIGLVILAVGVVILLDRGESKRR